jgi:hypothetical protein
MLPPGDGATSLVVFSHPNHELAVFGLVQRLRPYLVYLTDGGGEDRVDQTRRGLAGLGLLDRASFLGYPEQAFYDALLDTDAAFFAGVASDVGRHLRAVQPDRVLCDAVEFYNPVHDLSLPIVRAAARAAGPTVAFEVPLIHQAPGDGEVYSVQRRPPSRRAGEIAIDLTDAEVDAKIEARDRIYTILARQMGPVITALPRAHLAREVVSPADEALTEPQPDCVLRYERRARLLAARGAIDREITYARHYRPVAASLAGA